MVVGSVHRKQRLIGTIMTLTTLNDSMAASLNCNCAESSQLSAQEFNLPRVDLLLGMHFQLDWGW